MAIFCNSTGEWHERRGFVRTLEERQYRTLSQKDPELELDDFIVSPDLPCAFALSRRRHVSPKRELQDGKTAPVDGKVIRGGNPEAVYKILLPEGTLQRLPLPAGFEMTGKDRTHWFSRLTGMLPGGVIQCILAHQHPAGNEDWESLGAPLNIQDAKIADYYLAEYDTLSNSVKKISKLLSPFY